MTTTALIPTGDELTTMLKLGEQLVKSGLLPTRINSGAAALAVIQTGKELGVPPMQALRSIHIVEGKPTCGASLMAALIYRAHGDDALKVTESSKDRCVVAYKRRSWSEALQHTYTIQQAQGAGLTGKDVWKKYPDAMLRARCISAVATMAFPDVVAGMYTPEELGAEVEVDDGGEIQVVTMPQPDGTVLEGVVETVKDEPRRSISNPQDQAEGVLAPTPTATSSTRRPPPPQVKTPTGDIRPPAATEAATQMDGLDWTAFYLGLKQQQVSNEQADKQAQETFSKALRQLYPSERKQLLDMLSGAGAPPEPPADGLLDLDAVPFDAPKAQA